MVDYIHCHSCNKELFNSKRYNIIAGYIVCYSCSEHFDLEEEDKNELEADRLIKIELNERKL